MKLLDFINEDQASFLKRPNGMYMKGVNAFKKKNPGATDDDWKNLGVAAQQKYFAMAGVSNVPVTADEGKSPHKKGSTKYKKHMAAMHAEDIQLEDMDMPDLSDNMIGTPDDYYDAEQRQEAFKDLKDATEDCRHEWQKDTVIDGICPECTGSSCMDGDDENGEDSCYGWGNFGCDGGEMTQRDDGLPNWAEIIKHDKRKAERDDAKANYPGDEEVIKQAANLMPNMDDPRMIVQQIRTDFPQLGRARASDLAAKAKKIAFPEESINEGEERSEIKDLIKNKCEEWLNNKQPGSFLSIEDLKSDMHDYANQLTHDDLDSSEDLRNFMSHPGDECHEPVEDLIGGMFVSEIDDYIQTEGRIEDTFATDTVDKHDKKPKPKRDEKTDIELAIIKKLSGIKVDETPNFLDPLSRNTDKSGVGVPDFIQRGNSKYQFFPNEINADGSKGVWVQDGDPKLATKHPANSSMGKALLKQRANALAKTTPSYKAKLKNDIYSEDADAESNEADVAKILAKALGDKNRWTEMSAQELYAELESTNSELADTIKDIGRMLYGVKLAESKVKYHDSNECPCECGMPICKGCGRPHHPKDIKEEVTLEDNQDFNEEFGVLGYSEDEEHTFEAEYQGRKVKLNKPTRGDVKKFKVYVKDPKTGNVKKVNFGHGGTSAKRKTMRIRKSNPKARKSFRARHNCSNPGPKTKARYWSCRKW